MRGSLVIIAALCVIAVAEASSVRFVSVDESQNGNGKDKTDRNGASEGSDLGIKKSVDDVVKKISDGNIQSEKTVKNLEADRSPAADKGSESVKKSASSEKPKIQKRDVRKALNLLAKRGAKRASAEETDSDWKNIFNTRQLLIKYLQVQKIVLDKVTDTLIFTVDRLEQDDKEKGSLISALKNFKRELDQTYDNAINLLGSRPENLPEIPSQLRNFVRADDIPGILTTLNQRNPLAILPIVTRIINAVAGAASVADMASSFGSRSNGQDPTSLFENLEKFMPGSLESDISNY